MDLGHDMLVEPQTDVAATLRRLDQSGTLEAITYMWAVVLSDAYLKPDMPLYAPSNYTQEGAAEANPKKGRKNQHPNAHTSPESGFRRFLGEVRVFYTVLGPGPAAWMGDY